MSDASLTDFEVGRLEQPPAEKHVVRLADDDEPPAYAHGRCVAIHDGKRCPGPAEHDGGLCETHAGQDGLVTIDDGPRDLIAATTGVAWSEFDNWLIRGAIKDREFDLEFGEDGGVE